MSKHKPVLFVVSLVLAAALVAGCVTSTATSGPPPSGTATDTMAQTAKPTKKDLILATTTSTRDSGLLDVLIPLFETQTGYLVKPIAVGSGQAMVMGERGDADVLLVHAPESEKKFVAAGHGINRQLVMHNDFLIVGPERDPAKIKGTKSAKEAMEKIAASGTLFVSRGDDSGTHQLEKKLWILANVDPAGQKWYQATGQGMGETLRIASEKDGYTITDRATYLALKKYLFLRPIVEGDKLLLNVYHVMQVNPNKSDRINAAGAKAFVEFMVAPQTQKIIGQFGVDKFGESLFYPDAGKPDDF